MPILNADSATSASAITATNSSDGRAVEGISATGQALYGESRDQAGVVGVSQNFVGIWADGRGTHPGVFAKSARGQGVHGESVDQAGVTGLSLNFVGVWGEGRGTHPGIFGKSTQWQGVHGESVDQAGVAGYSDKFVGVWAETKAAGHPALVAKGPSAAALFDGSVQVNGPLRVGALDVAAVISDLGSRVIALEKLLESRADSGSAGATSGAYLGIDVDAISKNYRLWGGGFPSISGVDLTITRASAVVEHRTDLMTDASGGFQYNSSINCGEGPVKYSFVVKSGGLHASTEFTCTPS